MNLLIGTLLLAAAFGIAYDGTANERNERPDEIPRIRTADPKSNVDIGTVAHELQHALEVLRNPRVRSAAGMSLYYMRFGISTGMDPRLRETPAAVAAGHAVRLELRNATRAAGRGRTHVTDITASK